MNEIKNEREKKREKYEDMISLKIHTKLYDVLQRTCANLSGANVNTKQIQYRLVVLSLQLILESSAFHYLELAWSAAELATRVAFASRLVARECRGISKPLERR